MPVLLFIFLTTFVAAADEVTWEFSDPSGRVRQSAWVYPQRIEGLPTAEGRLDLELSESLSLGSFSAKLEPWVLADFPDIKWGERRVGRARIEAKEAWIDWNAPDWELRVGNQILSWGAADGVNPIDLWNAYDYSDLFQGEKLPATLVRLQIHPESWQIVRLEMVGTPYFRAHALPLDMPESGSASISVNDSRWLLFLPTTIQSGAIAVPIRYEIEQPSQPATWQGGARASLSNIWGWDFTFMIFSGIEKIPRFYLGRQGDATDPDLPVTVTLAPSFHRELVFGLDGEGSTLNDEVGLRFEAAYHRPSHTRLEGLSDSARADLTREDYIQAVVGADYRIPFETFGVSHYLNAFAVIEQNVTHRKGADPYIGIFTTPLPTLRPFDRNTVVYLENKISGDLKTSLAWTWSWIDQDGFLTPKIEWELSDAWRTELKYEVFMGSQTGFYGQFADNSRVMGTIEGRF